MPSESEPASEIATLYHNWVQASRELSASFKKLEELSGTLIDPRDQSSHIFELEGALSDHYLIVRRITNGNMTQKFNYELVKNKSKK